MALGELCQYDSYKSLLLHLVVPEILRLSIKLTVKYMSMPEYRIHNFLRKL